MYENPISEMLGEIQTKIIEHEENRVLQAVQNCGITVDKEELTKALMYDRQQYEKGYADAKAEQRWIPVSERLPEEKTEVLVTSNGYLYIASYEVLSVGATEYWSESIEYRHITNVTAWMPLPEPYKGEK